MGVRDLARAVMRRPSVAASEVVQIGEPASPIDWESYLAAAFAAGDDPRWLLTGQIPKALAMSLPVVRKGLLVFDLLGSCPLTRWRDDQRIEPGSLLEQPEPWCPAAVTVAATIRDLVLYPYAWWMVVEREWTGYPKRVVRLDPEYVQVETVPGTEGKPMRTFATYQGAELNEADLIRFDGPDEGLLIHGRRAIWMAYKLESAAERAASPEVPEGVITSTSEYQLEEDEARRVLDEWRASRAERRTAFLQNAKYEVLQPDPAKLQLIEARDQAALDLARMMNIPNRFASVATKRDSMTYTTVVEERRDLIDISFAPYVAAIEGRLSMSDRNGSPRGQKVRFDYTAFLRGSPADRTTRAQALVPLGVMSRQEARDGEPDLTGPAPAMPKPSPAAGPTPAKPSSPDAPVPAVDPNNPDEAT